MIVQVVVTNRKQLKFFNPLFTELNKWHINFNTILIKPTSQLMFRRVMVLGSLRCGKISPDSNDLTYKYTHFSLILLKCKSNIKLQRTTFKCIYSDFMLLFYQISNHFDYRKKLFTNNVIFIKFQFISYIITLYISFI